MKKSFLLSTTVLVAVLICAGIYLLNQSKHELVLDAKNRLSFPEKFRIAPDLRIIGSAQFSQAELSFILANFQKPFVIVDLRRETHGFIDGNAVSWMKKVSDGEAPAVVSDKSNARAIQLAERMGIVPIYEVVPDSDKLFSNRSKIPLPMVNSISEPELAAMFNVSYVHFSVDYYNPPDANTVDQFVKFLQSLPQNTWLYMHCRDGIKRTNVFMTMTDMMRHAKDTELNTILYQQYVETAKGIPKPYDTAQLAFLKQFYAYCRSNTDNFKTSWSEWVKKIN